MNDLLKKEVEFFMLGCREIVGNHEKIEFNLALYSDMKQCKITSPIEQLMYIALHALIRINQLSIIINPQYKIGKYRVDFSLSYIHIPEPSHHLIIECDSQQFHERDEKERRYEKQRDRFLTSKGYKFLHFTGKEIKDDPLMVAKNILKTFTNLNIRRA